MKAKAGNGEISITWSAPADTGIANGQKADITSYTVYYAEGTEIGDITQAALLRWSFPILRRSLA